MCCNAMRATRHSPVIACGPSLLSLPGGPAAAPWPPPWPHTAAHGRTLGTRQGSGFRRLCLRRLRPRFRRQCHAGGPGLRVRACRRRPRLRRKCPPRCGGGDSSPWMSTAGSCRSCRRRHCRYTIKQISMFSCTSWRIGDVGIAHPANHCKFAFAGGPNRIPLAL